MCVYHTTPCAVMVVPGSTGLRDACKQFLLAIFRRLEDCFQEEREPQLLALRDFGLVLGGMYYFTSIIVQYTSQEIYGCGMAYKWCIPCPGAFSLTPEPAVLIRLGLHTREDSGGFRGASAHMRCRGSMIIFHCYCRFCFRSMRTHALISYLRRARQT